MTELDDEFVTVQQAARMLGMGRMTFYRRLKELALPIYRTERDKRLRLLKRSDVARAFAPKPEKGDGQDGN